MEATPFVSVIVPVKNRPTATQVMVQSFIDQDYPASKRELILVGDVDDETWRPLSLDGVDNIHIIEADVRADGRDANAKRNVGLRYAKGKILILTDSDVILPVNWLRLGVRLLLDGSGDVVAGGLVGAPQGGFLSKYTDNNPLGSKTPRMWPPYLLTRNNVGKGRYKQPITANLFFTREVYETVGGLDQNFTTPYEDYPFADKILWCNYKIWCDDALSVWHQNRDKLPDLMKEYWFAGAGCADYIRKYRWSNLAKARRDQLVGLVFLIILWTISLTLWPMPVLIGSLFMGSIMSVAVASLVRDVGGICYFGLTVGLSALFFGGMMVGLIHRKLVKQNPTEIVFVKEL